jgi:hypothetical protein
MAKTVEGPVTYVKTSEDVAFFGVQNGAQLAVFILWFGSDRAYGPIALWLTHLTIALSRGLKVRVLHDDTSAFVIQLTLLAP